VAGVALVAMVLVGCPGTKKAIFGCRGTEECTQHGRCSVRTFMSGDAAARCFAGAKEDCAASVDCIERGVCDYVAGEEACEARSFSGCAMGNACKRDGACTPSGRGCEVTSWGCRQSRACADEDRCDGFGRTCRVDTTSPERWCDQVCKREGGCERDGKKCLATKPEHCRESEVCRSEGRCSLDATTHACVASVTDDCRASNVCRGQSRCQSRPGADICVAGDPCDLLCWSQGRCASRDAACVAKDNAACAKSVDCVVAGICSSDGAEIPMCVAASDADCKRSLECRAFGRCDLHEQTIFGKTARACALPSEKLPSRMSCSASPDCASAGRCLSAPDYTCKSAEEAGLPPYHPPPLYR
jgi:hypothetical protein